MEFLSIIIRIQYEYANGEHRKERRRHGLDYNTKLKFEGINTYGGKICKDNQGRYVVKVEDHPSVDEVILMANYQGDRYMAPDGVMYLVSLMNQTT